MKTTKFTNHHGVSVVFDNGTPAAVVALGGDAAWCNSALASLVDNYEVDWTRAETRRGGLRVPVVPASPARLAAERTNLLAGLARGEDSLWADGDRRRVAEIDGRLRAFGA